MRTAKAFTRHELQLMATAWDGAIESLRHEDGTPVEIVAGVNPWREALEAQEVIVP